MTMLPLRCLNPKWLYKYVQKSSVEFYLIILWRSKSLADNCDENYSEDYYWLHQFSGCFVHVHGFVEFERVYA